MGIVDPMSAMRVIHVIPAIAEEATGPAYSVTRLCESLIAEGTQLTLAALDWAPLPASRPYLKAFPLGQGPRRLGRSPTMHRWLDAQAAGRSVDVLHNHSLWMMPNVYPGRVARRHQVPLVVSPRGALSAWAMRSGSGVKRVFWPLIQHPALVPTSCFHATAESEYQDIRRMGFRQPVAIIPNGIDIPPASDPNQRESRTLLFLGRVHPIKGVDLLIRAWRLLSARHHGWRLRIVGPDNGGYLRRMESLAAEFGLSRIDFTGPLYGAAKMSAYRQADVFVLPTHSENFGMAVAEALASGTPAVVSKGAPWAGLETEGAGWWIEIGLDPLVACLDQVMQRPRADLQVMGENGRRWMQRDYSWTQIAQKTLETYAWLISGTNRPDCVIED